MSGPAFGQASDPIDTSKIHLGPSTMPPSQNDIIVTAHRQPKVSEVAKQAESVTPERDVVGQPLAQFQNPVCPGVVGLPRDVAELIVDRVRYDAERAKIPTADPAKCQANVLIVITRNGQADVKAIAKHRPDMFGAMESDDVRALENDAGPVHAWTSLERRGRHGELIGSMDFDGHRVAMLQEPMAHSRIYLTTRMDIQSSILLLDLAAINGLSVNQVADYAAMRTLVNTRVPKGEGPAQTILTLFDPNAKSPLEMTEFDLAYLKETYAADANLPAYGKLVSVARDVRKATTAPKPDAEKPATAPTPAPSPSPSPAP